MAAYAHVASCIGKIFLLKVLLLSKRKIRIHYYYFKNVFTDNINWFAQSVMPARLYQSIVTAKVTVDWDFNS